MKAEIKQDKEGKDSVQPPREKSLSGLFNPSVLSGATWSYTELSLAANHARRRGDRNLCVCVCSCGYYWVDVIRPKRQAESICS